jgi:hypothetical protein
MRAQEPTERILFLAWLLDDAAGTFLRPTLSETEIVVASDLTLIECDRVLHRAAAQRQLLLPVGRSPKLSPRRRPRW